MERYLVSRTQWAESGGQGDLGQIFIQIVNFQEVWHKTKMLPLSGSQKSQIRAFKWGTLSFYSTLLAILYISISKLSKMISYVFYYISNKYKIRMIIFFLQFRKTKFGFLCLDSNLWPLGMQKKKIRNRKNKIVGPKQGSNHRPLAY